LPDFATARRTTRFLQPFTGFAMLRWFHALMPKEERFFVLFARHSDAVLAGAEALRSMLEGGAAVKTNYQTVMDREHDADDVTREVLIAVRRTFITPFDRGNIRDLITSMDNSIDQMQKTAKSVMLFDLNEFTPQMRDMADAIVKCAQLVREAVPLLQSISAEAGHISDLTAQISAIEGRADELHDIGLHELYRANVGGSGLAFFVGNEVYDHLEKVVDRFDDVANVMHGIVIEHV
jgi:predicted phosphate transport protein (TIGR00153 family)